MKSIQFWNAWNTIGHKDKMSKMHKCRKENETCRMWVMQKRNIYVLTVPEMHARNVTSPIQSWVSTHAHTPKQKAHENTPILQHMTKFMFEEKSLKNKQISQIDQGVKNAAWNSLQVIISQVSNSDKDKKKKQKETYDGRDEMSNVRSGDYSHRI